jgi:TolB-like protein
MEKASWGEFKAVKPAKEIIAGLTVKLPVLTKRGKDRKVPKSELIELNPFENVSGDKSIDFIGMGIAESLTTRLSGLSQFRLVERMQLEKIYDEQRLTSSALFNPETTAESGLLLGADYIISGSFQKLGKYYRLDGRMLNLETSEVVRAESIIGTNIMKLSDKLGDLFINSLAREVVWKESEMEGLKVEVRTVEELPSAIYHILPSLDAKIVEITLKNETDKTLRLVVEVEIQGYTHTAKKTIEIKANQEQAFTPPYPVFITEKLDGLLTNQSTAFAIKVKSLEGKAVFEETKPVVLLSRDTWVFENNFISERIGQQTIAAWVTPQSNTVAQVLSDAVKFSPFGGFVGYQPLEFIASGNKGEEMKGIPKTEREITMMQVKAMYEAIKEKGIRYVDQSLQFPDKDRQRVLLPEDSLRYKRANCIDGAVLFSSLMLQAGINPIILLVPGHAFVGWETWAGSGEYEVLETTKVGYTDFEAAVAAGQEQAEMAGVQQSLKRLSFPDDSGVKNKGSATILNIKQLKQKMGDMPL